MKAQVTLTCLLSVLCAVMWMGCSEDTSGPVSTTLSIDNQEDARRVKDGGGGGNNNHLKPYT